MMGGLTFMVGGHMCCGVTGSELMLRLGEDASAKAIAEPHVRPMVFTGKPLKAFVFVASEGVATDGALRDWLRRALRFVEKLPPRKPARTAGHDKSRKRPTASPVIGEGPEVRSGNWTWVADEDAQLQVRPRRRKR